MALSPRTRLFAYLAGSENTSLLVLIWIASWFVVVLAFGFLCHRMGISLGWVLLVAPAVAICLTWLHLRWTEGSEAEVISARSSAQRDLAMRLWEMPLDEARQRAGDILKRSWSQPLEDKQPLESRELYELLHPSLRELFQQYEALSWHQDAAIGWKWLNRLQSHPQYLRIGLAEVGGIVTLAVRPREPDIYELDFVSARTLQFNSLTHFASIYHLMLFENQFCICPNCRYNLCETPNRCPECGATFPGNVPMPNRRPEMA